MGAPATTLRKYKSHKVVEAVKIDEIRFVAASGKTFIINESEKVTVEIKPDYMRKHSPEVGGYYVKYPDGYESFSPAPAFEEGYTEVS